MLFVIKYGEFGEDVMGCNSYNDFISAYELLKSEGHSVLKVYKIANELNKSEIDEILLRFE